MLYYNIIPRQVLKLGAGGGVWALPVYWLFRQTRFGIAVGLRALLCSVPRWHKSKSREHSSSRP